MLAASPITPTYSPATLYRDIVRVAYRAGLRKPRDIAEVTGLPYMAVRGHMGRMLQSGEITR